MRIRVSIVEDDAHTRRIFADWLGRARDLELLSQCESGEQALAALPAAHPEVVLMDINLPGLSGVETVRRLKPGMPKTQFLMLTVYEDADHIFDALAAGASGYLLKQTSPEALLEAVREVHQGGSPMTSNIARKVVQSFRRQASTEAEDLSPREQEVLELVARGYLYKEIAEQLVISVTTVNTYIRRIYEKLHVRSRAQAVARYADLGTGRPRTRPAS